MRRRTERNLTQSEVALWVHVARSVRPLPGNVVRKTAGPEQKPLAPPAGAAGKPTGKKAAEALTAKIGKTPMKSAVSAKSVPPTAGPALKPLAPLERRLKTQLKRGIQPIEAVIDLHGMRQDEAHGALVGFLWRAQSQGAKLVLVVTGKGAESAGPVGVHGDERGVLRRMTPHWLRLPDLRGIVSGFDEADQRHGGSGALYVRLRRRS